MHLTECAGKTGIEEPELKRWVRAIERKRDAKFIWLTARNRKKHSLRNNLPDTYSVAVIELVLHPA